MRGDHTLKLGGDNLICLIPANPHKWINSAPFGAASRKLPQVDSGFPVRAAGWLCTVPVFWKLTQRAAQSSLCVLGRCLGGLRAFADDPAGALNWTGKPVGDSQRARGTGNTPGSILLVSLAGPSKHPGRRHDAGEPPVVCRRPGGSLRRLVHFALV